MSGTEGKGSEVEWRKARRVMCGIKGKVMQVLFCELEIIRESQNSRTEVEKINSSRGIQKQMSSGVRQKISIREVGQM